MELIEAAMNSVAQSFAIPAEEMKRYLEAAAVGKEWEPEKVQILLDHISGE